MKILKKTLEVQAEIKKAVLLMRFHKENPTENDVTFLSFVKIAKICGLSVNQATHICRHAIMKSTQVKRSNPERILCQEHIDFLINPR